MRKHDELRQDAKERAAIIVHALLQTISAPHVTTEMTEKLLKDAVENTYVAGFAAGHDYALDDAEGILNGIDRYRPGDR